MTDMKKVKYLKIDRGRYYYQRRVPDQFRELLGFSKWQTPCGPVSYAKAVQLVVNWAEEHDDLLASLRTEDGFDRVEASVLRNEDEAHKAYFKSLVDDAGFTILDATDDQGEPVKPWQHALREVAALDRELSVVRVFGTKSCVN